MFCKIMDTKICLERMVESNLSNSSGKATLANSSIKKCTGIGSSPPCT